MIKTRTQLNKGNALRGLACITQFDMMKNWGWDIIPGQDGPLAGPKKYFEYNQYFEVNID